MMTRTQKAIAQYLAEKEQESKSVLKAAKGIKKRFGLVADVQHIADTYEEPVKRSKVKLEPSPQPKAEAHEITFVDERKFNKSLEHHQLSGSQRKDIYGYILESPRANKHFWDFTHGKKKNFQQLIDNMTR